MRSFARSQPRPHPLRTALIGPAQREEGNALPSSDDVRLFVTAWLGGLVFFGTFLG